MVATTRESAKAGVTTSDAAITAAAMALAMRPGRIEGKYMVASLLGWTRCAKYTRRTSRTGDERGPLRTSVRDGLI